MYLIYFIVAIICTYLTKVTTTANQEAIEQIPIAITALLAILWAPIVEESLFRGVLRRFINNKTVFVIVSGVSFGLLHSVGDEHFLLNALPYMGIGICMAAAYAKSNNIWTNIFMHFTNNAIGVILMYLINGL